MSSKTQNKKVTQPKEGRTLLVKAKDGKTVDESWFTSLEGLAENGVFKTENTGSYFLTFTSVKHSVEAIKKVKKDHKDDVMVKFAKYTVFFKFNDSLPDDATVESISKSHVSFVESNTDSSVLHYSLWMKNGNLLGCGVMTLDTKDALDKLLSKDHHKEFTLGENLSGVFYRYDPKGSKKVGNVVKQEGKEKTQVATASA